MEKENNNNIYIFNFFVGLAITLKLIFSSIGIDKAIPMLPDKTCDIGSSWLIVFGVLVWLSFIADVPFYLVNQYNWTQKNTVNFFKILFDFLVFSWTIYGLIIANNNIISENCLGAESLINTTARVGLVASCFLMMMDVLVFINVNCLRG